jgi:hypothetical protein
MPKKKTRSIGELKKLDMDHIKWLSFQKMIQLKLRLGLFNKSAPKDMQLRDRLNDLTRSSENNKVAVEKSIRRNKEKVEKRELARKKRERKAQIKKDADFVKSKKFEKEARKMVETFIYVNDVATKNPDINLHKNAVVQGEEMIKNFKERFLNHPEKDIRTIARQKYERVLVDLGIKK